MSISPELQAKIDALEDEKLKTRILGVLTGPGTKRATDEEIYESILHSYTMAKEQQARRRKWRDDEVVAFAQYFSVVSPDDYVEFLRVDKEFNNIDSGLAWDVYRLISEWMPKMEYFLDDTALFSKLRDYARSSSWESDHVHQALRDSSPLTNSELQAKIGALPDEKLRVRILWVLASPVEKRASDEATYEIILSADAMAKERLARARKWRKDEVIAFTRFFSEIRPEHYAEFLRQKDFSHIEPELATDVCDLMRFWAVGLDIAGRNELFKAFQDYVKTSSEPLSANEQTPWVRAKPISPELQAEIDELEDGELKTRILRMLSCPWRGDASDGTIYEVMKEDQLEIDMDREHLEEWGPKEPWRVSGGARLAEILSRERPGDYAEFIRQEREFGRVEPKLVWDVLRFIRREWLSFSSSDCKRYVRLFHDHVKSHLI